MPRSSVLRRADLAPGQWKGGVSQSGWGIGIGPKCSGYEPKQSDLVRIGFAVAKFKSTGVRSVVSESDVFKTAAMTRAAWQRTFRPEAAFIRCTRHRWATDSTSTALPLSYRALSFPSQRTPTRGYRIKSQYRNEAGETVASVLDAVFIAHGRSMTTLVFTAPASLGSAVQRDETRIAKRIIGRISAKPAG